MTDDERRAEKDAQRRRLRGFGYHLIGYFVVMIVLVPVNMITSPQRPWFILPMIGWGTVLGIHAAFAMNLFRSHFKGRTK
jgi:2TM domain